MIESEKEKEYRRHARWDLLGIITWILTFGPIRWLFHDIPFRGRRYPRTPPITSDEPPLVSLTVLAEKGLDKPAPKRIRDREALERVLILFNAVSKRDGTVSAEEAEFVENFVRAYGPEDAEQADIDSYLDYFHACSDSEIHIKNTCFLLKPSLKSDQLKLVVKTLYRLANLHGLEIEERRTVDNIGKYLGLSPTDIRHASIDAQRKVVEEGDDCEG